MNITYFEKENRNDSGCAPVCLQMALDYFEQSKPIEEIYRRCESIGESHYTLPWGMMLATASFGLHATFISGNPYFLIEDSIQAICETTGRSKTYVRELVDSQIERCGKEPNIQLLKWDKSYQNIPETVVSQESGVVIPTILSGAPHNVVLTKYGELIPQSEKFVWYHDPSGIPDMMILETQFLEWWLNESTDNDLLIISKEKILD
jgi:hypothetical protein